MAVTIYKGGKYRALSGKKIKKGSEWIELPQNAKIKANGSWHDLSFHTVSTETPELQGPTLTEATLVHQFTEETTTGNVLYMTPIGNGNKTGENWENAFSSSQIHVAMLSLSNGDRLYISEGDYGVLDRPITIPEGVSIYGGFDKNDLTWQSRDAFNHQTFWGGNGEFPMFDFTSTETPSTIDGITCNNFSGEISQSENVTFLNMVLTNGDFNVKCGLTNSKSTNCEITAGEVSSSSTVIVSKLLNVCDKKTNCTIYGNLVDSTVSLYEGVLIANEVDGSYIEKCSKINSESTIENSQIYGGNISTATIENSKLYEGNISTTTIESSQVVNNKKLYCETIDDCMVVNGTLGELINLGGITQCASAMGLGRGGYLFVISDGVIYFCGGSNNLSSVILQARVVDDTGVWTCFGGEYGSQFFTEKRYRYGIKDGKLYSEESGEFELISNRSWEYVDGCYNYDSQISDSDNTVFSIGLALDSNGFAYKLLGKNIVTFNGSKWKKISRISCNNNPYAAVGIQEEGGYLYSLESVKKISDMYGWTQISHVYGICNGKLYKISDYTPTLIDNESGWTCVSDTLGIKNSRLYSLSGETPTLIDNEEGWTYIGDSLGVKNGVTHTFSLYTDETTSSINIIEHQFVSSEEIAINNSSIINSSMSCLSTIKNSKIINSIYLADKMENSLVVNSTAETSETHYSTIVNSECFAYSGYYNVFWNNSGNVKPEYNAQSAYNENNLLTLGFDNSITRFNNTGYFPAIGIQDLGDCPNPEIDKQGYDNYISSFGNWKPQADSFLIGKGEGVGGIDVDIEGQTRPEKPTLGAYEG